MFVPRRDLISFSDKGGYIGEGRATYESAF